MNAAPTICKACGNPMLPKGSDICDACIAEGARADSHDLTHKLYVAKRHRAEWALAAGLAWRILVLGAAGITAFWLARQLL